MEESSRAACLNCAEAGGTSESRGLPPACNTSLSEDRLQHSGLGTLRRPWRVWCSLTGRNAERGPRLLVAKAQIKAGVTGLDAVMQGWTWGWAEGLERRTGVRGEQRKKRSSQASWKTCCLGTPFPRSALFL